MLGRGDGAGFDEELEVLRRCQGAALRRARCRLRTFLMSPSDRFTMAFLNVSDMMGEWLSSRVSRGRRAWARDVDSYLISRFGVGSSLCRGEVR
jgi:hypothetical protein